jgi:uncharacterized protein YkwD
MVPWTLNPTKRARRVLGVLTAAAVLAALGTTPATASTYYRTRALRLVNSARVNNGRKPVKLDVSLSRIAVAHTRKMIESGRISNVPTSTLRQVLATYQSKTTAAVVGCGPSLLAVHRALLADPPHRRVILLQGLRRVGIGVIRPAGKSACGKNAFWLTEIFYG